jgi:hypothetical protein
MIQLVVCGLDRSFENCRIDTNATNIKGLCKQGTVIWTVSNKDERCSMDQPSHCPPPEATIQDTIKRMIPTTGAGRASGFIRTVAGSAAVANNSGTNREMVPDLVPAIERHIEFPPDAVFPADLPTRHHRRAMVIGCGNSSTQWCFCDVRISDRSIAPTIRWRYVPGFPVLM